MLLPGTPFPVCGEAQEAAPVERGAERNETAAAKPADEAESQSD
jgi:hypothetical protein